MCVGNIKYICVISLSFFCFSLYACKTDVYVFRGKFGTRDIAVKKVFKASLAEREVIEICYCI